MRFFFTSTHIQIIAWMLKVCFNWLKGGKVLLNVVNLRRTLLLDFGRKK